jgi:hypothetical protein
MKTTDPEIRITRLRLVNFRGLAKLDVPVGPSGLLFLGTNGEGKTTAIDGINAVCEGLGIGPEAIRLGSDKAEILVDLEKVEDQRRTALVAKRTITPGKTTIALTGSDGVPLPKAKEQLAALFGGRALDPLRFYLADAKEQRRQLLAANPVRVTSEDLTRWTGIEQEWNTDGHGQEVLARVRKMYFDRRTTAGQVFDQAKAAVALKQQEASRLVVENPESMTPEAARTHVAKAEQELAVLHDRRRQAEKREAEAAGTRQKVTELRERAERLLDSPAAEPPKPDELAAVFDELAAAQTAFEQAQRRLQAAKDAAAAIETRTQNAKKLQEQATEAVNQANELEAAIANTLDGDGDPIAMQAAAAEEALETARTLVTKAEATAKWLAAESQVLAAEDTLAKADTDWTALDRIVKTLTDVAPAEIAAHADLIPGLEITADAILLDGKDTSLLCGAEKMQFAVTLAKRMAGKAKILTVDGLEQIAPAKQPSFVRLCLEGGWMLFATVVADGAMQVIDAYQFANP